MPLGAFRLNRVARVLVLFLSSVTLVSCGSYSSSNYKPPSGLTTRVFASQSVSGTTASAGLVIIDGSNDTLPRASEISAGSSPGLMALSPARTTLLVFDTVSNAVQVVNAKTESLTGSIPLAGPSTSMVALDTGFGYAAVPTAPMNGSSPGAVEVMNLTAGGLTATIGVPNAQTVVASADGTQLLVFSNDSDAVTIVYPLLVNTANPDIVTVSGFDRPVYALFSSDGSTAYVLNCGPECGSASSGASVQILNLSTTPPTAGASVTVDAATVGWLSGTTLYVAGTPATSPNNLCTGQTKASTCGRLDTVDVGSMTMTGSAVITDGYHDRISMSGNGQLFIGSHTCTSLGNVNNPQGEVRGCLSIFNTTNATVIIPPDNGDVTGLQNFTNRDVEYVVEGGNVRVYDTTKDKLLSNSFIGNGTITFPGQFVDVKAVDFF
jgi:hypothetical protein